MKPVTKWVRENLALPAGMVLIAAVAAGGYQAGEANADTYKMLTEQWPRVAGNLRAEIADAMQDDHLTRWESTKLVRDLMNENRGIVWGGETGTVEQERAGLQRVIKGGQPTSGG